MLSSPEELIENSDQDGTQDQIDILFELRHLRRWPTSAEVWSARLALHERECMIQPLRCLNHRLAWIIQGFQPVSCSCLQHVAKSESASVKDPFEMEVRTAERPLLR